MDLTVVILVYEVFTSNLAVAQPRPHVEEIEGRLRREFEVHLPRYHARECDEYSYA